MKCGGRRKTMSLLTVIVTGCLCTSRRQVVVWRSEVLSFHLLISTSTAANGSCDVSNDRLEDDYTRPRALAPSFVTCDPVGVKSSPSLTSPSIRETIVHFWCFSLVKYFDIFYFPLNCCCCSQATTSIQHYVRVNHLHSKTFFSQLINYDCKRCLNYFSFSDYSILVCNYFKHYAVQVGLQQKLSNQIFHLKKKQTNKKPHKK